MTQVASGVPSNGQSLIPTGNNDNLNKFTFFQINPLQRKCVPEYGQSDDFS
jgi:hypothetical protein